MESKKKPYKKVGTKKSNRISDAELTDSGAAISRFDNGETGDVNAPPIEWTEEEKALFAMEEAEKDAKRIDISSNTTTYGNEINVWRLISKTYNEFLQYEHVTTAMQMGYMGVLVCVKEAVGNKSDTSTCFIPGVSLSLVGDKYQIN